MFLGTNAATVRYICTGCSPFVCVCECRWVCTCALLTVNGDGHRGKGGAITLGLSMGLPQEGHAPVFAKADNEGKGKGRSAFAS